MKKAAVPSILVVAVLLAVGVIAEAQHGPECIRPVSDDEIPSRRAVVPTVTRTSTNSP
jgi:hypothetical protein